MNLTDKIRQLIGDRKAEAARLDISRKVRLLCDALGRDVLGDIGESAGSIDTVIGWSDVDVRFEELVPGDPDTMVRFLDVEEGDIQVQHYGKSLDLLSSGINMQLHVQEAGNVVKVYHESRLVFHEEYGNIAAFRPDKSWLDIIEVLLPKAEKASKVKAAEEESRQKGVHSKQAADLLRRMEDEWGINLRKGK